MKYKMYITVGSSLLAYPFPEDGECPHFRENDAEPRRFTMLPSGNMPSTLSSTSSGIHPLFGVLSDLYDKKKKPKKAPLGYDTGIQGKLQRLKLNVPGIR
jgi:hypothetical protein